MSGASLFPNWSVIGWSSGGCDSFGLFLNALYALPFAGWVDACGCAFVVWAHWNSQPGHQHRRNWPINLEIRIQDLLEFVSFPVFDHCGGLVLRAEHIAGLIHRNAFFDRSECASIRRCSSKSESVEHELIIITNKQCSDWKANTIQQ